MCRVQTRVRACGGAVGGVKVLKGVSGTEVHLLQACKLRPWCWGVVPVAVDAVSADLVPAALVLAVLMPAVLVPAAFIPAALISAVLVPAALVRASSMTVAIVRVRRRGRVVASASTPMPVPVSVPKDWSPEDLVLAARLLRAGRPIILVMLVAGDALIELPD